MEGTLPLIDKKALGIFLGMTYGISWLVAVFLYLGGGISEGGWTLRVGLLVLGLMLVPAAAALVASILTRDRAHLSIRLWPINPRPVLVFAVLAPVFFIVVYTVSVSLGYGVADWGLGALRARMPGPAEAGLQQQMPAPFLLIAGFLMSVVLGPTLFALIGLGTEIGWRAYLAQKLEPLGRWGAAAVSGLLWGICWFPLVLGVAWAGESTFFQALSLAIRISIAAALFGMLLAEVYRRSRHVALTSVLAGCFYAQEYGIWYYLIRQPDPLMTGPYGAVGIVGLALLVLIAFLVPRWERLIGIAPPPVEPAADSGA